VRVHRCSGRYRSAVLALLLACAPQPAPEPEPAPEPLVVEPAPAPAPGPCARIERLVAYKAERTLEAHCEGGQVLSFPAAFGREPRGAKRAAGDERTPEGDYRVAGPARASRYHRFLPIDYPSAADADAGLAAGTLSAAEHRRIVAAHERGEMPPQETALGGLLGLHGEGARWRGESQHLDWTYGCIALADADLDFVIARVRTGTPVTILPDASSAPR
jgi:murein L,D-transpeptidase YafK